MSDLLKENGTMTKYKTQIVQKYNNTSFAQLEKTILIWISLGWGRRTRDGIWIYRFTFTTCLCDTRDGQREGAGETKLDLRFHPTPTLCHGRRGVKHEEILAILAEKMQI